MRQTLDAEHRQHRTAGSANRFHQLPGSLQAGQRISTVEPVNGQPEELRCRSTGKVVQRGTAGVG